MRILYLISLSGESEYAWRQLAERWPDAHRIIDGRTAIVAAEQATTSQMISDAIGMDNTHQVTGLVVQMGHFFGWHDRGIWEWVEKAQGLP